MANGCHLYPRSEQGIDVPGLMAPELKLGPTRLILGAELTLVPARVIRSCYSYLSARIGSIRLARRAGIRPAVADTAASNSMVAIAIHGSLGWMPYS